MLSRIVSEEKLTNVGDGMKMPNGGSFEGARVRIEYAVKNKRFEEDIYGFVESYDLPVSSMYGRVTNTMWTVEYLFGLRAEKGKLDSLETMYRTVLSSFRINPAWFNRYTQVVTYLIRQQIRSIRSAGELSRIISQTHNQISDEMSRSYEERQKVYDGVAEKFSRQIRDVDAYYSPVEGREVELPGGYRQAWTNDLGEIVLTEQEDYNPNIGSNQHWQRMERK